MILRENGKLKLSIFEFKADSRSLKITVNFQEYWCKDFFFLSSFFISTAEELHFFGYFGLVHLFIRIQ